MGLVPSGTGKCGSRDYALPLLWRGQVIGWGNLAVTAGVLSADFGYVARRPRERAFTAALDDELAAVTAFLGL